MEESPLELEGLSTEGWETYVKYRREIRKPTLKFQSAQKLRRWLVDQGDHRTQQLVVDQTIRNGWAGLFELKNNGANYGESSQSCNKGNGTGRKTTAEAFHNNLKVAASESE